MTTSRSNYYRQWREANADKKADSDRRWREANPEKMRAYHKQYRVDNAERIRERKRAYRQENKNRIRAYNQQYREDNLEAVREREKQYREANKGRLKELLKQPKRDAARNRQARKRGASGSHNEAEWQMVLDLYGGLCAYCKAPATVRDHVVPLSKGGDNGIWNIVPACYPCNDSKRARYLWDWTRRPQL